MLSHFQEGPLTLIVLAELLGCCVPIYLVGLLLGRWLKRRRGVRLGFLYQALCVALAWFVPLHLLDLNLVGYGWNLQRELESAVIVLSTVFFLALLDRFFWDRHFRRHQNRTGVTKFLQDVVAITLVPASVLFVVLFF